MLWAQTNAVGSRGMVAWARRIRHAFHRCVSDSAWIRQRSGSLQGKMELVMLIVFTAAAFILSVMLVLVDGGDPG